MNLDVDIKTFIRIILRHLLVGFSSIRAICVIRKHNLEVEFLHFSTINIWADNYLWYNCSVYYGMFSSILGLYPLDPSNT